MLEVKFKKLVPGAEIPAYANPGDAGLDLKATSKHWSDDFQCFVYGTGLAVEIPEGYVGMITSKSGLMAQEGITSRGTIDCGYTGSIKAVLFNHSQKNYIVDKGQKITQLVILPIVTPEIELVEEMEETMRQADEIRFKRALEEGAAASEEEGE